MAEIIPDSTITLLFNVPLNNNYENTYWFSSVNEQTNFFFNNFSKQTFNQQSYQRKNRGWLRLSARYRDVYNANYMYFINNWRSATSSVSQMTYEQKIFYAFITEVNYINDMTVEIHYEIDVIQTYMFNWTLPQCMVERETVDGDSYFKNYIDEGIPISEYDNGGSFQLEFTSQINGVNYTYPLSRMKYVVAATVDEQYRDSTDEGVDITSNFKGAVCGCQFHEFASADACVYWLNEMPPEKYGSVLAIYLVPEIISKYSSAMNMMSNNIQYSIYDYFNYRTSYRPVNKKMYHYCSLVIQNSDGASMSFDPTQFYGTAQFILVFSPVMPLSGYLKTMNYKMDARASGEAISPFMHALPMPSVPTFTWSNDTYKAWLALNSGYMQTAMATAIVDGVADGVRSIGSIGNSIVSTFLQGDIGALANSVAGTAQNLTHDLAKINDLYTQDKNARIVPDSFNGSAENQASALRGEFGFHAYFRWPLRDVAVSLDKYFTMFGYRVRELKQPSLNNRTRFTFVKTVNMDVEGLIPTDDRESINNVFNNGIRFWKDKTNFCDYSILNECNNPVID